jgi:hypothetical protein
LWRVREADSELWAELGGALALGGSFHDENMFVAPYTSSRWPGQYSGFEYVPLIAANVRVRDAPRADAGVLSTLSFAILARARLDKEPPPAWTAVRVEGKTGYVESQYVRSPTDYRAFFAHRDGRWQLVTFIAGD